MKFDISYAINNHFLPFLYLDREISLFDILWLITQFKISFNLEFSSLSSKLPIQSGNLVSANQELLVRCLKEKIVNVYQFLLYWVSRKQATQFISQWLVVSYFSHLNVLLPYSKYCLNIFTVLQYYLFLVRFAAKDRFKILYNYHKT